jgi:hypothetical protein
MWKSNRWCGPEVTHVINIIVLEDTQGDDFIVKSDCVSTPFLVISSHKKSPRLLMTKMEKSEKKAKKEKDDDGAVTGGVPQKRKYTKRARPNTTTSDESSGFSQNSFLLDVLIHELSQAQNL